MRCMATGAFVLIRTETDSAAGIPVAVSVLPGENEQVASDGRPCEQARVMVPVKAVETFNSITSVPVAPAVATTTGAEFESARKNPGAIENGTEAEGKLGLKLASPL